MSEMIKRAKQVIVVRKDLTMSPEKMAAQVAHASLGAVLKMAAAQTSINHGVNMFMLSLVAVEGTSKYEWLKEKFTKIVVYAANDELLEAYRQAEEADIPCSLIVDAGDSEFKGVKTLTCCAIGPAWSDEIDPITGKFPTRKK